MSRLFRRAALAVVLFLTALFLPVLPATAAEPGAEVFAFTLDPAAVVQFLIAVVLPVLVGLVTTRVVSGASKAWLLAGLTLATSLLVELARAIDQGTTFDLGVALMTALPAFVVSVSTHYGLWKPTGVSAAVQSVGAKHRAS